MPWDIKPIGGSFRVNVDDLLPVKESSGSSSVLPASYNWLRQQRFDPEAVAVGTNPFRKGSSGDVFRTSFDPMGWSERARPNRNAVLPLVPTQTDPILPVNKGNRQKWGQLVLDELDPIGTYRMLTGSFLGRPEEPETSGISAYLHERDMDLFGMGESGMPVRLTDYALSMIPVAASMMAGQSAGPVNRPIDSQWEFQTQPEYWDTLAAFGGNDVALLALAKATVSRTSAPEANPWLVQKLYEQFKIDRAKALGETSGDKRVDYVAKRRMEFTESPTLASSFAAQAAGGRLDAHAAWAALTKRQSEQQTKPSPEHALAGFALMIPFIGTEIAEAVSPIRPETEKAWRELMPKDRQGMLGSAAGSLAVADLAATIPLLSGVGLAAGAAKGATGLAGAGYKAYDWSLRVSKGLMALGVTSATATWAMESFVPIDFELGPITGAGIHEYARRVDMSRPVSQSDFMGAINALGFFSSGTFGAATAVQGGRIAIRSVAGKVGGIADRIGTARPLIGVADTRLFAYGLGGSDMHVFATRELGLDPDAMRVSANRLFVSEGINTIRRRDLAAANGSLAGLPAGRYLDGLDDVTKTAVVSNWLARPLESAMNEMEAIVRNLHLAQKGEWIVDRNGSWNLRKWRAGTVLSDDAQRAYRAAARNARTHDDALARGFVQEYGARFITELTGGYSPQTMRRWLEEAIPRVGGVVDKLPPSQTKGVEWWAQLTRKVYHYQFDRWAAVLDDAAEGAEEAARVSIMSRRHVFKQDVDEALDALRGGSGEEMARFLEKREVQDWILHETQRLARRGDTFTPTPEALADHLEDIYDTLAVRRDLPSLDSPTSLDPLNSVQRAMEEEGLWTVGYKPVNEAGDAIATVTTRTGQHVQARWFDYPLSSADNVELGNRGWLMNKLDSVTRGFRTWRIMEYQRASLFRSLSYRTEFSPAQIEAFHEGVMALSRKHGISPQGIGRTSEHFVGMKALPDEVQGLADSVFGPGPHVGTDGKPIDWRHEIGMAYQQAYRMNLTAGLTSHLKARFGQIGEAITWGSDYAYVMWRFGLSPLFKGGELWESAQFNLMRRVDPTMDPWILALYAKSPGAQGDIAMLGAEVAGEPYAAGLGALGPMGDRQAAAAMLWHARQIPEDHQALLARQAMAARNEERLQWMLGGQAMRNTRSDRLNAELLDLTDEAGAVLPGNEVRVAEILRELDDEAIPPAVREALAAYPEGAPTAAQLAEAADLRETAAAWREQAGKMEGFELTIWQHAIAKGWMPDDEALRVWRRLDELVTDLEENQAINAGKATKASGRPFPPDLTDPITGQPVLRDIGATDREYATALRSLRSRRAAAKKKIVPPSIDDMAYRLEAFAESVEAPRPILRSERVGPEDALPEGYTLDPAEVYVQGQLGPNGEDGLLNWLDVDGTLPEDRGMWHATTAIDGVLDYGLLSRMELLNRGMPDDLRAALSKAYNVDNLAPDDVRIWTADGKDFRPSHDDLDAIGRGERGYLRDPYTAKVIDPRSVTIVENALTGERLYTAPKGLARAPEGLSAGQPDTRVSVTTDWNHAETIAERFKLMGAAANGKASGEDIVGHFLRWYDDLLGDEEALVQMASALHGHGAVEMMHLVDTIPAGEFIDQMAREIDVLPGSTKAKIVQALDVGLRESKVRFVPDHEGFYGYVGFAGSTEGWKAIDPDKVGVVRVAGRNNLGQEVDPADAVAIMENAWEADPGEMLRIEFSSGTGYTLTQKTSADDLFEMIQAEIDNARATGEKDPIITAVQTMDVDGNVTNIAGRAHDWKRDPRVGPDDFELQFDSRDVFVIDPRTTAEPIADNERDLLRQLRQTVDDEGNTLPGFERRQQEVVTRLDHMRQEAMHPDPVDRLEDIAETPEGITANLNAAVEERRRGLRDTFWNPTPTKMRAAFREKVQLQREEFPRVIQGTPAAQIFRDVAGPERGWADWLVRDRDLLDQWLAAKASGEEDVERAAFDALLAHAGDDVKRAEMDALYASEEWDVIASLWALNMRGAQEESFATHFFSPYRSPIERSINHPVLGVYPASWALKTAREWAKFLFDNRSFGVDLRLGMSPAVAIANISRAQEVTFAQGSEGDQTWEEYLEDGPLGSTLFVFNLLMPGDWSAIPMPLSRTIRESMRSLQRGEIPNAGDIAGANFNYSGVSRDLRLLTEMTGEWWNLVYGEPTSEDAAFPELAPNDGGIPVVPRRPPSWIREATTP